MMMMTMMMVMMTMTMMMVVVMLVVVVAALTIAPDHQSLKRSPTLSWKPALLSPLMLIKQLPVH